MVLFSKLRKACPNILRVTLLTTAMIGAAAGNNALASNVDQKGIASYYADYFDGRTTASGEIFRQSALTAAHRTLPFGTVVTVTRRDSGKQVDVVINDRGPFVNGRVIDLSKKAARELGMLHRGTVPVELVVQR